MFVSLCPTQDFVRLPLQNQSSQSSHAMAGSSLTSSSDAGLSGAYGLTAGQVNPGYTSGAGNAGFEAVSRPLDVASGAIESGSAALLRCYF